MIGNVKAWFSKESSFFFLMPAVIWQALFFVAPLAIVLGLAFFSTDSGSITLQYFSDIWYSAQLFIILRSITLATITSVITLLIAYPVAYFIALRVKKYAFFFLFLLMLPFLINLLVQVYSWFFVLGKGGFLNMVLMSLGILKEPVHFLDKYYVVYVVMIHIYLPFMVMPLYSILEKFDYRLIEASRDLGSSFARTFTHVIFPLTRSGVQTGFFIVLVTSFGEYIIPSLLGGNKTFFVGTLVAEYFFIGKNWHSGSAFIILSIIVLFVASAFYNYIFAKLTVCSAKDT